MLKAHAKLVRRVAIRRKALIREIDLLGAALRNGDRALANYHEESATALLAALASDLQKIERLKSSGICEPAPQKEPANLQLFL